jgi:hypothetical protein
LLFDLEIGATGTRLEALESVSRELGPGSPSSYVPDCTEGSVHETVVLRLLHVFHMQIIFIDFI